MVIAQGQICLIPRIALPALMAEFVSDCPGGALFLIAGEVKRLPIPDGDKLSDYVIPQTSPAELD